MVRNKSLGRALVCAVLLTSLFAVLPAAAQEAEWIVSDERGTVGISSPDANDTISGEVEITGTATSPSLWYYKVEYSADGDTWYPVDGDNWRHEDPVNNDVLTTWDTIAFRNGTYQLRAVVVDATGNYVASNPTTVTIAKAAAQPPPAEEEAVEEPPAEEPAAEEPPAAEEAAPASSFVTTERGTAGISEPDANETVSGQVEITGTATSPTFLYYKVEFSVDGDMWSPVDGDDYRHEDPATNGLLATWDTTAFRNGSYQLRAVVVDVTGNYVASNPITVVVNNPAAEG